MLNSSEFVSCIGKAQEAPEVQQLLASLGITTKLKMPKDSIDVRHDLPASGVSLIFEPEGPKSSRLIYCAVQFYSDAEQGYTSFPGDLPNQLRFSDGRAEAHAKLGPPFASKMKVRLEVWQVPPLRLGINYTKEEPHRIGVITVQLPPAG